MYAVTLSVTSQLPGANGYTGGKVVFIDTENTLYPFGLKRNNFCINSVKPFKFLYININQAYCVSSKLVKFHDKNSPFFQNIIFIFTDKF